MIVFTLHAPVKQCIFTTNDHHVSYFLVRLKAEREETKWHVVTAFVTVSKSVTRASYHMRSNRHKRHAFINLPSDVLAVLHLTSFLQRCRDLVDILSRSHRHMWSCAARSLVINMPLFL